MMAGLMAIKWSTLGWVKGTITAGCDSSDSFVGVSQWTLTRQATRYMQGGANVALLWEIRGASNALQI